jgi:hypothetical protein
MKLSAGTECAGLSSHMVTASHEHKERDKE